MVGIGAAALVLGYLIYYLANDALPGNSPVYPRGWWGWWDQSQYLASATALAARDFSAAAHWYPLGYAIAGAPFARHFPAHPFFFVDLAGLLGAYAGFLTLTRRAGVPVGRAVLVFVCATFADSRIGMVWAEPWNTTLSAGLIWGMLGSAATILARPAADPPAPWTTFLLGLLAGAVPLVRPADTILPAILLSWVGLAALRRGWRRPAPLVALVAGIGIVMVPYALLHWRIYGPHPSQYMIDEQTMGFVPRRFGWKLYEIVIDPRPWFPSGTGLLARFPWLPLGFAGMAVLAIRPRAGPAAPILGLLAVLILATWALLIDYIDLLPSGLWRYHNIHYFKWTLPGLGLLALWCVERLRAADTRRPAALALGAVLIAASVRLVPVPARPGMPIAMLQIPGLDLAWTEAYFGPWRITDAAGTTEDRMSIRVLPDAQGVRLLPQRRNFAPPVVWVNQPAGAGGPPVAWSARLTLGYPCWLPPYPCERLAP